MSEKGALVFGATLAGVYWWLGGVGISWFLPDPLPYQIQAVCVAIGVGLYLLGTKWEDMTGKFPVWISLLTFAPPGTMLFAGIITWAMSLVGLFGPFKD